MIHCIYWTSLIKTTTPLLLTVVLIKVGIDVPMNFKMAASMDDMKKLMKKRDEIESEIKALHEVLDSVWQYFVVVVYKREVDKRHKWHWYISNILKQKGIGMNEPLIDSEGYPRADIDVYTVRHARHKVICKCHFKMYFHLLFN